MRAPLLRPQIERHGVIMTPKILTRGQAKARAQRLRAELAAKNQFISHSAALERVAKERGYADWNTLSADLPDRGHVPLHVGDRVEGHYLKRPFQGDVLAVRTLNDGDAFAVTVRFDAPVDVVVFDSFSAFRQQVSAVLSASGVSLAKTGDGVPHLVLAPTSTAMV